MYCLFFFFWGGGGAACRHSFCATDSACSCGVAPRVLTVSEAKGNL